MSNNDIRPLALGDLQAVMEVFESCFVEDEFYCRLFASEGIIGSDAVRAEIQKRFSPQIAHVLKHDLSYGAWIDDDLVAFIINFDYMKLVVEEPEWFKSMFYDGQVLPYERELHEPVRRAAVGRTLVFLLSIAVLPEFRRQHIASQLLDRTIRDNAGALLASDVSNTPSLNMYRRRGFFVRELEENYHFVLGPSIVTRLDAREHKGGSREC